MGYRSKTDLMGVRSDRDAKCTRQPKVRQFQVVVLAVNQQILRFKIPVQDAVHVAVRDALQHLIEVQLRASNHPCQHCGFCLPEGRSLALRHLPQSLPPSAQPATIH